MDTSLFVKDTVFDPYVRLGFVVCLSRQIVVCLRGGEPTKKNYILFGHIR